MQHSRFTLAVQEDRDLLGLSAGSTWPTLCGNKDTDAACHAEQMFGGRQRQNPKQPFAASQARLEALAPELGAAGVSVIGGAWRSVATTTSARSDL